MIYLLFVATDHSGVTKKCKKGTDSEGNNTDYGRHLVVELSFVNVNSQVIRRSVSLALEFANAIFAVAVVLVSR